MAPASISTTHIAEKHVTTKTSGGGVLCGANLLLLWVILLLCTSVMVCCLVPLHGGTAHPPLLVLPGRGVTALARRLEALRYDRVVIEADMAT